MSSWLRAIERLSAKGSFLGRHILSPKPGVAVHINAYNFSLLGHA